MFSGVGRIANHVQHHMYGVVLIFDTKIPGPAPRDYMCRNVPEYPVGLTTGDGGWSLGEPPGVCILRGTHQNFPVLFVDYKYIQKGI